MNTSFPCKTVTSDDPGSVKEHINKQYKKTCELLKPALQSISVTTQGVITRFMIIKRGA